MNRARSKLKESRADDDKEDEEEEDHHEALPSLQRADGSDAASMRPPKHEEFEAWKDDVLGLSYVTEHECILHDDEAEEEDEKLDHDPDGPYFVGFVIVVKKENPVAKIWVRRTFAGRIDRGFTYMALRRPNDRYDLVTSDPVLQRLMANTPNSSELFSQVLSQRMPQLIDLKLAKPIQADVSKISSVAKTFSAVRLFYESFYGEHNCFDFLQPPQDYEEQQFAAFMETHEGGEAQQASAGTSKAVAVPVSFWNRAVRGFRSAQEQQQ